MFDVEKPYICASFSLQRLITVDVNGRSLMSEEINEVTDLVRLYTSPNRGLKPAAGIIRAVTIIANEEYGRFGNLSEN